MRIAVVGTGYVGLVAGACFAESGNQVVCIDVDEKKIGMLKDGEIPIYEPGLKDVVLRNYSDGRLSFSNSLREGVEAAEIIFIAVGTPPDEDGSADLTHVLEVAEGIGKYMNGYKVVVNKSTVPVGTAFKVREKIASITSHDFDVVSNPEFLKEGAAMDDFLKPDRVVVGVEGEKAAAIMRELYAPFVRTNKPILVMDNLSAEMTKYAANTMLASRISLMNEIASLCRKVGADIEQVRTGIGSDGRIGSSFLFPGIGYGGSCFPKDVRALIETGEQEGCSLEIPKAVEKVNDRQKKVMVEEVRRFFRKQGGIRDKKIGIWGLAFKPRTDDVREAPSLVVCRELVEDGASLALFDPEARDTFRRAFGENTAVDYKKSSYEALDGADALVICTEWNEFRRPDFDKIKEKMRAAVIFDGRNLYNPAKMAKRGFVYVSIGRPPVGV